MGLFPRRRRISAIGDDRYAVRLDDQERALLLDLVGQLREAILAGPGDSTKRLFPPAHADDAAKEAEYRSLVGDALLEKHLTDLDILEATARSTEVDEEGLNAWMGAINSMRLVLGTTLDISEDLDLDDVTEDDPRLPGLAVYQLLTMYLAEIVDALAGWD